MKNSNRGVLWTTFVAVSLGIWVGSCIEHEAPSVAQAEEPRSAVAAAASASVTGQIVSSLPDFASLSERALPAVVSIYTTKTIRQRPGTPFGSPEQLPPEFRQFFRRFMPDKPREYKARGLGSGFVISADGFIVTNNHVIDGADEVRVRFDDGDKEGDVAEIIGADPATDLALLKLKGAKNLPSLPFGSSDTLRIGEWVVAIGNPFELSHTVTAGIVSAKGRRDVHPGGRNGPRYADFIQTDASINPGNSGGPLLNLRGEVIGINSAIFSQTGGSIGIGFAIPSNMAKDVIDQLQNKGRVDRGWIGVHIQPVTPATAKALGLDETEGALIAEVMPDGPAEKAGLKQEDVIVEFNGQKIHSADDLPLMVSQTAPGTQVELTVIRDGKPKKIRFSLAAMPKNVANPGDEDDEEGGENGGHAQVEELLGMSIRDLTGEEAEGLGVGKDKGALIDEIDPNGPAAEAGLAAGDVVQKVRFQKGGQKSALEIHSAGDFAEAIEKAVGAKAPAILVYVWRNEQKLFFSVELPKG